MSDDDFEAAIQAAAESDAQAEADHAQSYGTPAGETAPEVQPEETEEVEEPEVDETEEPEAPEAPEDTFDGGQFNPDELPEELRPGWRQLQGAFTRKTQEIAGTLREAEALLGLGVDAETATHAVDLYSRINDPDNWLTLYEQLGQVMEQNGIEVPGAKAALAAQTPVAPAVDDAQLDALVEADPDLAPLVATLRAQRAELSQVGSVQARLDALDAERQAAIEEAEQMRHHQTLLADIQRQESDIRSAFTHYKDEDVDMVYEVSTAHAGDLIAAQERLESYVQGRIDRAMASKGRPKTASTKAAPVKQEPRADETLEDIHEETVEHLRALQRAGSLDI
jgi:hypothetical protein